MTPRLSLSLSPARLCPFLWTIPCSRLRIIFHFTGSSPVTLGTSVYSTLGMTIPPCLSQIKYLLTLILHSPPTFYLPSNTLIHVAADTLPSATPDTRSSSFTKLIPHRPLTPPFVNQFQATAAPQSKHPQTAPISGQSDHHDYRHRLPKKTNTKVQSIKKR